MVVTSELAAAAAVRLLSSSNATANGTKRTCGSGDLAEGMGVALFSIFAAIHFILFLIIFILLVPHSR